MDAEGHATGALGSVARRAAGSPVSAPPVVAPARDVELSFDLAWLNVAVFGGNRPLPDARVSVSSLPPDSDGARRSSFFLAPFHEGELQVEAPVPASTGSAQRA